MNISYLSRTALWFLLTLVTVTCSAAQDSLPHPGQIAPFHGQILGPWQVQGLLLLPGGHVDGAEVRSDGR